MKRRTRERVAAGWRFYAVHSGLIAGVVLAVLLIALICQSIVPLTTESQVSYEWTDTSVSNGARIMLHVQPAEIDLKSETLRTFWFQMTIYTLDGQPFKTLFVWPLDSHVLGAFPPLTNGTYDWTNLQRTVFWELLTRPEKGAEPWGWQMARDGEYPWDRYHFDLLLSFNRTTAIERLDSGVSLSHALSDEWKVAQSFQRLSGQAEFNSTLRSIGFTQQDFEGNERRLPMYLNEYVDYYLLRISFFRQSFAIARGVLAFWIPATFLAVLLIVAFGRIERLKISEALTVFLGTPLAALPFIVGAQQLLPPRISGVELLFYGEVAASIGFAAVALARVKRVQN